MVQMFSGNLLDSMNIQSCSNISLKLFDFIKVFIYSHFLVLSFIMLFFVCWFACYLDKEDNKLQSWIWWLTVVKSGPRNLILAEDEILVFKVPWIRSLFQRVFFFLVFLTFVAVWCYAIYDLFLFCESLFLMLMLFCFVLLFNLSFCFSIVLFLLCFLGIV